MLSLCDELCCKSRDRWEVSMQLHLSQKLPIYEGPRGSAEGRVYTLKAGAVDYLFSCLSIARAQSTARADSDSDLCGYHPIIDGDGSLAVHATSREHYLSNLIDPRPKRAKKLSPLFWADTNNLHYDTLLKAYMESVSRSPQMIFQRQSRSVTDYGDEYGHSSTATAPSCSL